MFGFLLLSLALAAQIPEESLQIFLLSDRAEIEHGVPFQLELTHSNVGQEPFYIERPTTIGATGISIQVRTGSCNFTASPNFEDLSDSQRRFFYTPLFPGDQLITRLAQFNDLAGMETLDFPGPGSYEVQVVLHSEGNSQEGLVWPIWRGQAVSKWLPLQLQPPSPKRLKEFRSRLQQCLAAEPCDDFRAIEYFRLVEDGQAAKFLIQIFQRDYSSNPRVVEALATQSDPEIPEILEEVAAATDLDPRIRDYFSDVIERIRSRRVHPCQGSAGGIPPVP